MAVLVSLYDVRCNRTGALDDVKKSYLSLDV